MHRRVLLVDDEPHILKALNRALRKESYEILSAKSAQEALTIMKNKSVDLVVSDDKMPGMSGTEFFSVVCREYPDTIRIILTGHASLESAMKAINEGGIYRFFLKPWNDIDLALTIRQALKSKDLVLQNKLLLKRVREQSSIIQELEREHPGITRVKTDSKGTIIVDDADVQDMERCLESFLINDS